MKCKCGEFTLVKKNTKAWRRHVEYTGPGEGMEHTQDGCARFSWR
jgi:hypothetical protein